MSDNPFAYKPTTIAETAPRGFTIKKFLDVLQFIVLGMAVLVLLYLFFIIPTQVDGSSMFPNLKNDEILFTNRLIQQIGGPGKPFKSYNYQRGDIVVFKKESIPKDVVKRVIGMPNDRVRISAGRVYINDQLLTETYIDLAKYPTNEDTFLTENVEVTVPNDSYFLMGDNRTGSTDSRSQDIGFVKRSEIKGSPFLRVYPLTEFGYLGRGEYQLQ